MTAFLVAFGRVGVVVLVASVAGWMLSGAVCPRTSSFRAERLGWSFAFGVALLSGFVPASILLGVRPGWIPFLVLAALLVLGVRVLVPSQGEGRGEGSVTVENGPGRRLVNGLLLFSILVGTTLYALRALTEPMWANDFLAIWGFKGKTIFGSAALPHRLFAPEAAFSHPEYPLGLPFLFAGVSFLTQRWDDHAMALLFPIFQVATLGVLFGWLRRWGSGAAPALLAAALVSCFKPLYSGFLTGMAEVPLAFGFLLFGTAFADAAEDADRGAFLRLAFASLLIAATKNEGLFVAAVGGALGFAAGGARRLRVALAAAAPAAAVFALHVAVRGRLPVRDFDLALFSPARVGEALSAAGDLLEPSGWAGLALVVLLLALGSRSPAGDRLLALAGAAIAAYLLLPALAVRGPAWLVRTSLERTCSALAPLVAAGLALRLSSGATLSGGSTGSAGGPTASAANPG